MILRTKGVTIGALGTKRHSKEILRETLASQTLAKLLVQVVYFGLLEQLWEAFCQAR